MDKVVIGEIGVQGFRQTADGFSLVEPCARDFCNECHYVPGSMHMPRLQFNP